MALQTKTFSYGSLTDKSILKGYLLELTVTEQYTDNVSNTSMVDFALKLRSGSKNRFEKYGMGAWVSFNGAVVGTRDRYNMPQVSLGYNSSVTLVSGSCPVAHNEDGTLNMPVEFSIDMATGSYVPGPVSVTGNSMTLTAIPRASTVAASDANVGAVSTVVVGRKSAAYTHSVQVQFGGIGGYLNADGDLVDAEQMLTATAIAFRIPESFYTQIPTAPTGLCVLTCTTYAGSVPIGTKTAWFTVTAPRDLCTPALSILVRDVNENTIALTGDETVLVRFFSTARCTVAAEAKNAATLSVLSVEGQAVADGFADFPNTERGTFTARCTDSRSYTTEAVASAVLVPYVQLTCNPTAKRLSATGGDAVLTVRGNYFPGNFGREQNTLRLSCRIDGGEEMLIAAEVADNSYTAQIMLQGMDYTRAYTIEVIAADRLQTVVKTVTLSPGIPLFDWGNGDFNFNCEVKLGNVSLIDRIYPVGSIYMSMQDVSPAAFFGGEWYPIDNRFLFAASSLYPAGTWGGEFTHTLTAVEMPNHGHAIRNQDGTGHNGLCSSNASSGTDGGSYCFQDVPYDGSANTSGNFAAVNVGGNQPHNNMPPYLAVYMWQRIA